MSSINFVSKSAVSFRDLLFIEYVLVQCHLGSVLNCFNPCSLVEHPKRTSLTNNIHTSFPLRMYTWLDVHVSFLLRELTREVQSISYRLKTFFLGKDFVCCCYLYVGKWKDWYVFYACAAQSDNNQHHGILFYCINTDWLALFLFVA